MALALAITMIILPPLVVYACQRFSASRKNKEVVDNPINPKELMEALPLGPELFTKLIEAYLPRNYGFIYEIEGKNKFDYEVHVKVYDPLDGGEEPIGTYSYCEEIQRFSEGYPALKRAVLLDIKRLISDREARRMDGYTKIIT